MDASAAAAEQHVTRSRLGSCGYVGVIHRRGQLVPFDVVEITTLWDMTDHTHGISSSRQFKDAGIGRHAIASRIRKGEIERARRNIYRHLMHPSDERQRGALGLKAVKDRGVVTGAAGLRLLGHRVRFRSKVVDIAIAHGLHAPDDIDGVEYRRSSHLDRMRPTECDDLDVAPDWWCVGDLAYDIIDSALAEVIADAIGSRRLDLDQLEFGLTQRPRFPGRARLRRVIAALRSDLPFSATEKRVARQLRAAGITIEVQHRVTVEGGRTHLLDLAIPELRLDMEIDGPHHWLPFQATSDRRRDRELRDIDWAVERFSVYEIDRDPEAFLAEVLRIIERRRRELDNHAG